MARLSVLCVLGVLAAAGSDGVIVDEISRHAQLVHRDAIVIDAHMDTPQRILIKGVDIGQRLPDGHVDIPRMRAGGLDAVFFSVWIDVPFDGALAVKRTLQLIDVVNQTVAAHPRVLERAVNAGDVLRVAGAGRIAVLIGIEGGHAIADDLRVLRTYRELGVSYMTLTWANPTRWADSSGTEGRDRFPAPKGLNAFGREVVREMNRIGMVVDVSHVSDRTFFDVLAVTSKPVIASHSSCRALCDHPRNMTDDMLRALAANGGVVGINFGAGFLDSEFRKRAPPFERLIDHIDHAAKVAGIDHVGLGSDFDGVSSLPAGMEDVSRLPRITAQLLARGYKPEDVKKILGENYLRVLRAVAGT